MLQNKIVRLWPWKSLKKMALFLCSDKNTILFKYFVLVQVVGKFLFQLQSVCLCLLDDVSCNNNINKQQWKFQKLVTFPDNLWVFFYKY